MERAAAVWWAQGKAKYIVTLATWAWIDAKATQDTTGKWTDPCTRITEEMQMLWTRTRCIGHWVISGDKKGAKQVVAWDEQGQIIAPPDRAKRLLHMMAQLPTRTRTSKGNRWSYARAKT